MEEVQNGWQIGDSPVPWLRILVGVVGDGEEEGGMATAGVRGCCHGYFAHASLPHIVDLFFIPRNPQNVHTQPFTH